MDAEKFAFQHDSFLSDFPMSLSLAHRRLYGVTIPASHPSPWQMLQLTSQILYVLESFCLQLIVAYYYLLLGILAVWSGDYILYQPSIHILVHSVEHLHDKGLLRYSAF